MFSNMCHLVSKLFHACSANRTGRLIHRREPHTPAHLNYAALLSGGIQGLCGLKHFKFVWSERFTRMPVKAMSRCGEKLGFPRCNTSSAGSVSRQVQRQHLE